MSVSIRFEKFVNSTPRCDGGYMEAWSGSVQVAGIEKQMRNAGSYLVPRWVVDRYTVTIYSDAAEAEQEFATLPEAKAHVSSCTP